MSSRVLLLLVLPLLIACEVRGARTLEPGEICEPGGAERCSGPAASCLPLDDDTGICTHACVVDSECPAGLTCQLEPGGATARCAPGFRCDANADCPAGHRCDVDAGICFVSVVRDLCSPCDTDAQCPAGGKCAEARGTGERFCTRPCVEGACFEGYACREVGGSQQCVPERGSCEGGRPLCAPCTGDSQCGDGNDLCVENFLRPGERFCGVSCNPACDDGSCQSACPDSFRCADLSGVGEGPFQCVPVTETCTGWCDGDEACGAGETCARDDHLCVPATDGRVCAPCADDDDCRATGSRCIEGEDGDAFCAPPCGVGDACPLGLVCSPLGEDETVCAPAIGTCSGGAGRLGEACGEQGAAGCLSGVCLQAGATNLCSGRCALDADCADANFGCCAVVEAGDGTKSWDCSLEPGDFTELGGVCAPRGGLFGDACDPGRPPCQDGYCLDLGASRLCTATCNATRDCDIAAGPAMAGRFVCSPAGVVGGDGAPGESVRICFPAGGGATGSDCTFGAAACKDSLCIKKASGNVCTEECVDDVDCPTGWSCDETTTVDGLRLTLCLPPSVSG